MRPLPPLNGLYTFYVAARYLNFRRASEALHVTQGAVSRQIKQLEAHLEVLLFQRESRGVRLTREGKDLARALEQAFSTMEEACAPYMDKTQAQIVSLTTVPSLAARWLVPRLEFFQLRNPDIELRINTTFALVDLNHSHEDFAIRYGPGHWPGLHSELLFPQRLVVVCSPRLCGQKAQPLTLADIPKHRLLVCDGYQYWKEWLGLVGLNLSIPFRLTELSDANVAIQAALAAQGLALVPEVLVRGELAQGSLVCPFAAALPVSFGFFLAWPADREPRRQVCRVMDWLRHQAQKDAATIPGNDNTPS